MTKSFKLVYLHLYNKGMYEPHSTSNCAIGIHPMPPIWDLLFAKWHWTCFWHRTAVFPCKHHFPCAEYSSIN